MDYRPSGLVSIYAAGRIEYSRERFGMNDCTLDYDIKPEDAAKSPKRLVKIDEKRGFIYTGPYTYGCDHGCSHTSERGTRSHGDGYSEDYDAAVGGHSMRNVYLRALDGIKKADVVFVWIEDEECFGTLIEIGYAKALGKRIIIAYKEGIKPTGELWFAFESADNSFKAASAKEAYEHVASMFSNFVEFV